jgi:ABC-type uncharacterized transport system substrate-binding protein
LQRRGAAVVDKILKGAKPTDLPVAQTIKLDLVINHARLAIGMAKVVVESLPRIVNVGNA